MNARLSSTAVMARRVEPADSLDFFPTPPWATRAFCFHVLPRFETVDAATGMFPLQAFDPCCGLGHMALVLREVFPIVTATDVFNYGFGGVSDFLHPDHTQAPRDWIFMNPPFNLGIEFVLHALELATRGVAVLVRTAFLEGEGRYAGLFRRRPPNLIAQYCERVPMHQGRWVVNGKSATAYCWLVWHKPSPRAADPAFMWIPKSRALLTMPHDWLTFGGCWDLPKEHAVMQAIETLKKPRTPATIGDVARAMGALL